MSCQWSEVAYSTRQMNDFRSLHRCDADSQPAQNVTATITSQCRACLASLQTRVIWFDGAMIANELHPTVESMQGSSRRRIMMVGESQLLIVQHP